MTSIDIIVEIQMDLKGHSVSLTLSMTTTKCMTTEKSFDANAP